MRSRHIAIQKGRLQECPEYEGPSRCRKAVSVPGQQDGILISFALEDEANLMEHDSAHFEVYGLACPFHKMLGCRTSET